MERLSRGSVALALVPFYPGLSNSDETLIMANLGGGVFHGSAVVKFCIPTKAALQEAYSTSVLPFDVLVNKPSEKKFAFVSSDAHSCCCFEVHVCTARRPFPMEQRPQMDAVWAIQWGLGVSTSHTSLILQLAKNSQDDTPLLPQ
ncbi:hypothetical protein ZIOFF_064486 [Zingiber officinale]|uniref:Uncharacterized protein n=1 Tax=Zingiber officinale TaxID=94328 RepID=A0A8J5EXV8_ZINOF|nr:hypothetical protein ZIOFF_064486 [Zingiber officinale]